MNQQAKNMNMNDDTDSDQRPKLFSERGMKKRLIDLLMSNDVEFDDDNETGEILLPTGFYRNKDGGIQETADPEWETLDLLLEDE